MDYSMLASALLDIRAELLQVPANQQLTKMVHGELFVLNYLRTHKEIIHPKELSEKMSVSTARIAALLNHMEEKYLIVRVQDPVDSRQTIVRLTAEGEALIEKTRTEVISHVASMLKMLGSEDAQAYIRIQEKICCNYHSSK